MLPWVPCTWIVRTNSSHFSNRILLLHGISNVKLEIDFNRGYTILKEFPFLNSHLYLRHARCFGPSLIPGDVKLMELSFSSSAIMRKLKKWPASLTSLKIANHKNLTLIVLPKGLKLLQCRYLDRAWGLFPPRLETLTFEYIASFPSN